MAPTWLITGASSGLGLALAHHVLSTRSHNLITVSRYPAPDASLSAIAAGAAETSLRLHHLQLDLGAHDGGEAKLKAAVGQFLILHPEVRRVDVLVNNAAVYGAAPPGPLETASTNAIAHVMQVNFYAALWLTQAVLGHMRRGDGDDEKEEEDGDRVRAIVNISSTQGLCTDAGELAYDVSKHALEAMSGVLAAEVAPFGIRVLVANLGSFRTDLASKALADSTAAAVGLDSAHHAPNTSATTTSALESGDGEPMHTDDLEDAVAAEDPYLRPEHPVGRRRAAIAMLYASGGGDPEALSAASPARGSPARAAVMLFDAVMRTSGTDVNAALEKQRAWAAEEQQRHHGSGGPAAGQVERLVLASDAQPKIEKAVENLRRQVASSRVFSAKADAEYVEK